MFEAELDDARWAQVQSRDRAADGRFWCVVATTRIYCRPSCPARPHRRNVSFHDSLASARATGARACKRCDPDAA
ncbi:MAG: hypothetical protein BGN86_09940 [Caulobacterales bacterium 68-7]|nr:Ada metal-binding domain-containing protein [Caulobacterales bacterium]OJU13263.1 MAG: hypothetical protein BGN86_09940 [Caulobacterales bacterium 68-7]